MKHLVFITGMCLSRLLFSGILYFQIDDEPSYAFASEIQTGFEMHLTPERVNIAEHFLFELDHVETSLFAEFYFDDAHGGWSYEIKSVAAANFLFNSFTR